MANLSVMVPNGSGICHYLQKHMFYHLYAKTPTYVSYEYVGSIPPLAKISQLLAMFEPLEYTISKSTTGISFIIWSL